MIPSRRGELTTQVRTLCAALESGDEVDYVIDLLRRRGAELRKYRGAAHETLARQFLQQRHRIFGQMPGPWPIEFTRKLSVWHKKEGFDFTTHQTWQKRWTVEISRARFVRLGARALARYVELDIPVEELVPAKEEREEYGFKEGGRVAVYCTMPKLINVGPQWVMDLSARVRIARARAIAEAALQLEGEER
jgi:hypothetical protein